MADIFISYAREDIEAAQRLAMALEQQGWSVFWDRRIPAGRRFADIIAEQLAAARCVIALWSRAALASDWVLDEAEEARNRNVLAPAFIERVDPPMGFRRIHAADLVGWQGQPAHGGFQRLIEDIAAYGAPRPSGLTSGADARRARPHAPSAVGDGTPTTRRRWRMPAAALGVTISLAIVALSVTTQDEDRQPKRRPTVLTTSASRAPERRPPTPGVSSDVTVVFKDGRRQALDKAVFAPGTKVCTRGVEVIEAVRAAGATPMLMTVGESVEAVARGICEARTIRTSER
jgi:TIR domain